MVPAKDGDENSFTNNQSAMHNPNTHNDNIFKLLKVPAYSLRPCKTRWQVPWLCFVQNADECDIVQH